MVQLNTEALRKTKIKAKAKDVIEMILDVETTGRFFPGVDAVEKVEDMTFKFTLAERRTLGIIFIGEYTSHYQQRGSVVDFETVSGNLESEGQWTIDGSDGNLTVSLRIKSVVEVPIPRIVKKPATLFAEREVAGGIEKQLAKLKKHLEG